MSDTELYKQDSYIRKWQKENPEKVAQYCKKYYEENRQHILELQQEKLTCECGKIVNRGSLLSHKRSFRHLYYMK